ncbi:MAG: hypothetical protein FJ121_08000 [Deltaproteobacteria bacterium]|nr:hypothetical protein [Deltaproteobacteria bacterium]
MKMSIRQASVPADFGGTGFQPVHQHRQDAGATMNFMEQNIFLQAGALNLGAGVAGGFKDKPLAQALKLPENAVPFLVMPVGHKQ